MRSNGLIFYALSLNPHLVLSAYIYVAPSSENMLILLPKIFTHKTRQKSC